MKFNKTAIAAIISLGFLIGFSGSALAQHGMGNSMNGGQYHQGMNGGGYRANLTAEQQAIWQKVFAEYQTATANLHQQLLSKNYEYNAVLTSSPVDDKKLLAVSKEIAALRDSLYQHRVTMDTQLAKAGMPLMGHHRGMMGNSVRMGNPGPHCGSGYQ